MREYFYKSCGMKVFYPDNDGEIEIEYEDQYVYGNIYLNIDQLEELLKLCYEKRRNNL